MVFHFTEVVNAVADNFIVEWWSFSYKYPKINVEVFFVITQL